MTNQDMIRDGGPSGRLSHVASFMEYCYVVGICVQEHNAALVLRREMLMSEVKTADRWGSTFVECFQYVMQKCKDGALFQGCQSLVCVHCLQKAR